MTLIPLTRVSGAEIGTFRDESISIRVIGSSWKTLIGAEQPRDGQPWLAVSVIFDNTGKAPITLPSVYLVDAAGAVYEQDQDTMASGSALLPGTRLNPNDSLVRLIAFRVSPFKTFEVLIRWKGTDHELKLPPPRAR